MKSSSPQAQQSRRWHIGLCRSVGADQWNTGPGHCDLYDGNPPWGAASSPDSGGSAFGRCRGSHVPFSIQHLAFSIFCHSADTHCFNVKIDCTRIERDGTYTAADEITIARGKRGSFSNSMPTERKSVPAHEFHACCQCLLGGSRSSALQAAETEVPDDRGLLAAPGTTGIRFFAQNWDANVARKLADEVSINGCETNYK